MKGRIRCNSLHFYIKPQLNLPDQSFTTVVIHFISTSNHNFYNLSHDDYKVVIHFISTSNHNSELNTHITNLL